ncbi:hypothetical protein GCE9029_02680 [Grimontia celer]|uniref:3-oxo-tetronate kinase n=1 Tax=Grimontia celer TaxID=1796497 RepID=A0A128F426_9GAMM|nr:3-oxo-tetronate kinase [Grimontia celer]CZF81548.1 hypothetical protein GCE9029_02680 [Grimontia celer]
MKLGVIADDYTGATDAASFIVKNGLSTVQFNGVPEGDMSSHLKSTEAIVIGQKTRALPPESAVIASLNALEWLKKQGCEHIFFKYCSTFDSTEQGNIGPVTDALLDALNSDFTVVCPALPVNGRTVYQGYLFVHDVLLNESGMRNHPLTPMRDASLLRLMDSQSAGRSTLLPFGIVEQGHMACVEESLKARSGGGRYLVCDALNEMHLDTLGAAFCNLPLATGGSGLAGAIAKALSVSSELPFEVAAFTPYKPDFGLVVSGSCSEMTNQQVEAYQSIAPSFKVDVEKCLNENRYFMEVAEWVLENKNQRVFPMVYATVPPGELAEIQKKHGNKASSAIEQMFHLLISHLKLMGLGAVVSAGGETSGTVTQAFDLDGVRIGREIAPGVPWVQSFDGTVSLALKSGNFGDRDFFITAQESME